MAERKYLVTGANGFLGSNLVRHLVASGTVVRAMVRNLDKAEDLQKLNVEVVKGDLRDTDSLLEAAAGIEGVYNVAATFREGNLPDSAYSEINAEGTRRMLDASITAGVKRFIQCSTVGVLGDVKELPANENTPYNPGDIYQRTKLQGEHYALSYFKEGKIRGLVLRPAIIYGPGDTRTLKIWKMLAKGKFFYVGKGDKYLHWIDVRDLARAFELAMQHTELNNDVYIIPGQRAITLREMVKCICSELNVKEPTLHLPVKPIQLLGDACEAICIPLGINPPIYRRRVDFYTKNRMFSGEKAKRDLGFVPAKRFEEEIREITSWYKDHGWI